MPYGITDNQMLQIIIVTGWAVSRKRTGKHVPKRSRIDIHCYATVLVIHCTQYNFNWLKADIHGNESFKAQ
jgi:hypothetical protein